MKSKFHILKTLAAGFVAFGLLLNQGHAQQTNLFGSTNTIPNSPYYSISNYYSINSAQILAQETLPPATTQYYTNNPPTNYATGQTVQYIGAPKSLNVGFMFGTSCTNASFGAGTNGYALAYLDASTGWGDWFPFTTLSNNATAATQTYTGITTNTGGFVLFRINRIVSTGSYVGYTNVTFQYCLKTGL